MKTRLRNALIEVTDAEFRELQLAIEVANNARQLKKEFNLTDEQMYNELKIRPNGLRAYLSGGYDYHIRDIANSQALYVRLRTEREAEKAAQSAKLSFKVEGLDYQS